MYDVNPIYLVAEKLANKVREVFASEDSMQTYWNKKYTHLKFDRTDNAFTLCNNLMEEAYGEVYPSIRPTPGDKAAVARAVTKYLDFNLASQLILNLQLPPMYSFNADKLDQELAKLRDQFRENRQWPDPFQAKPKLAKADQQAQEWFKPFNRAINLQACSAITKSMKRGAISWRISPVGSTPALTDDVNLSMLRYDVIDIFEVQSGHIPLNWITIAWQEDKFVHARIEETTGLIYADGIETPFVSKSGGDILFRALFTRNLLVTLYQHLCVVNIIPRLNSITIVYDKTNPEAVEELLKAARFLTS